MQETTDEVSQLIVIKESVQAKNLLLNILKSESGVQSIMSMSLIPYLSNLCLGIDEILCPISKIEELSSYTNMLKRNRVGMKLLSDKKRFGKKLKILEKIIESNNKVLRLGYGIAQKVYIHFWGQKDLGIFFYNNHPVANSIQQSFFLMDFLVIDDVGNMESLDDFHQKSGKDLMGFSKTIAMFINSVASEFDEVFKDGLSSKNARKNFSEIHLDEDDYFIGDEKRRNIFQKDLDKSLQLNLFMFQCQINFIKYLLPEYISNDAELYIRISMINYLSVVSNLENSIRTKKITDSNQVHRIMEIIEARNQLFPQKSSLRNNIFHYRISSLDIESIDFTQNCIHEILKQSVDQSPEEFLFLIENQLDIIEMIISDVIGIGIS